ncbi:MAG: hypothetical protein WC817_04630 [Patescibacteria group bacterium]|jgi:hypothetical protein
MDYTIILTAITAVISAALSSWLTYTFAVKKIKSESALRFKEEKYANLLSLMQGFIGQTTSGETKKKFFEEQYKSWLYSSDEVVLAVNDLVKLLIAERGKAPDPEKGREVVGSIVLQMRKDLYGKTKLKYNDFSYTDVLN